MFPRTGAQHDEVAAWRPQRKIVIFLREVCDGPGFQVHDARNFRIAGHTVRNALNECIGDFSLTGKLGLMVTK